MKKSLKTKIEEYVDEWHWDENSKKYVFELGKFLVSFMDFIEEQKISERTKNKDVDNLYIIGMFDAEYGCKKEFHPENLENGPNFLIEFKRKISDSKYAVQSYKSTWNKLDKFIKSGEYENYLHQIEEIIKKE